LKINTDFIRCCEGRFRRAPGMETDVVESIGFAGFKNLPPRCFIGRRITGQRKFAPFLRAAQKEAPPIHVKQRIPALRLA
jgi:hypothetical protein